MKTTAKQYAQSLYEAVAGQDERAAAASVSRFAALLIQKHEEGRLPQIIAAFEEIWRQENKEISAELRSARPLSETAHQEIADYLRAKTGASRIDLSQQIEPDLLGGFVLRYGSKILDGSLKGSLEALKNKINN